MSEFEKYSSEAKAKWGETEAFQEYAEKTKGYSENKWESIAEGLNGIFAQFAKCMQNGEKPKSDKAESDNDMPTYTIKRYHKKGVSPMGR